MPYLRKICRCSKLKARVQWTGATLLPNARTLALLPASSGHISHPRTGTPVLEISHQPQSSITVFCKPAKLAAEPRTPRSGETNHKPPKFHKENFWALRPSLLFDKLSCSIYCKLQIANTKLLMKSGQPIKKFLSANKQNEPTSRKCGICEFL